MSTLTVDDCLERLQEKEDAVRDTSAPLDSDLAAIRVNFNLSSDQTTWPTTFSSRLAELNSLYGKGLRQALRLQSHNLRMVHARPLRSNNSGTETSDPTTSTSSHAPSDPPSGSTNPVGSVSPKPCAAGKLVTLIIKALRSAQTAHTLYTEFNELQLSLDHCNSLPVADRIFIRKTTPDLRSCLARLDEDARAVKEKFKLYKTSFYLLSDNDALECCLQAIRRRGLRENSLARGAEAPFTTLLLMSEVRSATLEEAADIGITQAITLFELPNGRVPTELYQRYIAEYEPLLDRIRDQRVGHDEALSALKDLHATAIKYPTTVPAPGPQREEILVERLLGAYEQYSVISGMCREMIEAATPLAETLELFKAELYRIIEAA